jgi:hypothetical protein
MRMKCSVTERPVTGPSNYSSAFTGQVSVVSGSALDAALHAPDYYYFSSSIRRIKKYEICPTGKHLDTHGAREFTKSSCVLFLAHRRVITTRMSFVTFLIRDQFSSNLPDY